MSYPTLYSVATINFDLGSRPASIGERLLRTYLSHRQHEWGGASPCFCTGDEGDRVECHEKNPRLNELWRRCKHFQELSKNGNSEGLMRHCKNGGLVFPLNVAHYLRSRRYLVSSNYVHLVKRQKRKINMGGKERFQRLCDSFAYFIISPCEHAISAKPINIC